MKENRIYLTGFIPDEISLIAHFLSEKGFQCIPIEGNPVDFLKNQDSMLIVLAGIHSKEDFSDFRKILADTPMHLTGCAAPMENRELIFMLSLLRTPFQFFLPPDANEVKKTVVKLSNLFTSIQTRRNVQSGFQKLSRVFEWETRDIKISEISRQTAGYVREAGFFKEGMEEEHGILALEEALVNAVEHGNLELDSSLRPESLLDEDRYEILKEERLKDPEFYRRKIKISITADKESVEVKIANDGPGFNASEYLKQAEISDETSREKIMEVSGKGLHLIRNSFDTIIYNDKGTEMILGKSV